MGCDIHTRVEARRADGWHEVKPVFPLSDWEKEHYSDQPGYAREIWDERRYATFGVLADVRNYAGVAPLSPPRGVPDDASPGVREEMADGGYHNVSHYTLKELLDFDWSKPCEDRRVTRQVAPNLYSGGETAPPGGGKMTTYGEHCGERFTGDLQVLKAWAEAEGLPPEDVRVVFGFDN